MNQVVRTALLLGLILYSLSPVAQTLFTYGNKQVTRQEFLKAFNKNNTENKLTEKALREYLDLYVPFKLKVQAAYDLRLDTLPTQSAELQAFRNQLVQGYLTDASSLADLVNEAFNRSQQDVRISHIFIPAPQDSAAMEARAAKMAKEAYDQLQQGKNFGEVAVTYSGDPSVKTNRGDLGYITVFSLPYELETLAYNTPLNKVSEPYRSKAGYHIFKKTAERKAVGKIKIAQILLAFPPDATEAARNDLRKKADSLYRELQKGADFAKMAEQHSNDNFSFQQGGVLPEFGTGRYEAPFELAAFALQKNDEISQPVLTEFGYHIIKRIAVSPVVNDRNNRAYMEQLEQQVQSDERIEIAKKAFLKNVLKTINYKKGNYNAAHLWAYTDSTLGNKPVPANTTIRPVTVIFSFAKQQVLVKDWLAFRRSIGGVDRISSGKTDEQLMDYYLELAALEYYRNHLEEYNADFAFQLKEFKDGNLLFEVMQRKVWDKASTDSTGLRRFYNARTDKYWWENSASAILFTALHDSTAKDLQSKLEKNINSWRSIVDTYEGNVIADSGRFEIAQLPVAANGSVSPGHITSFIKNESDNSVSFAYIIRLFPEREMRSFEDARGYVINDYQQHLESAWIAELRKKYPVKVNEQVLKSMVQ
ncbi:MAG TPA: peptidylprolyl isomerase [Chitinophagaceae bacterium]|nr:peptidylprolyl isomerase [Chitinophagaceae bacterium]